MVTLDSFPFDYSKVDVVNDTDNYEYFENDDYLETKGRNAEITDDISFHCSLCSYQTNIETLYDRHVAKHALVVPYLCSSCTYSDVHHGSFVDHMMTHQQGRTLKCNFCNYRSIPTSMRVHLLKHRAVDILDCSMCEFSTNYGHAMKLHMEIYHTREHVCHYCQNVMSKYSLIKHCWNAHGVVIKTKLKSLNELGYGVEDETKNDEPKTKSEFDAPIKSEPDFVGDVDEEGEEEAEEEEEEEEEDDDDDGEEVPDQQKSRTSTKTNTISGKHDKWIGKFNCEFCDFTTKYFYSKKWHVEKFHTKLYQCGLCDSVMTKHDLGAHCKDVHGQDINLKHCRQFVEVSSDLQSTKTLENLRSTESNGPSIIEAVKSASRKPRKKFGTDKVEKFSSSTRPSVPDVAIRKCPTKLKKMGNEPSSSSCELGVPFVLSIAEAVKSKSRKTKRKNSLATNISAKSKPLCPEPSAKSKPLCLEPSATHTRDIGTSIEDYFIDQEMPSLVPDLPLATERRLAYLHCSKCQYKTKLKSLMKHHAASHLPESHLACSKCDFSSDVNYEFARHLRSHSERDTVTCCFCSYTVAIKALGNLSNHLGTHRKVGKFFCSRCNYSCAVRQPLKDHFRVHHSVKHRCPECPRIGTRFRILKHMEDCHPDLQSKPICVGVPTAKLPTSKQIDGRILIARANESNSTDTEKIPFDLEILASDFGKPTSELGNPPSDTGNPTSDSAVRSLASQNTLNSKTSPVGTSNAQLEQKNPLQSVDKASRLAAPDTPPIDLKPGRLYCFECPYNTKKKPLLRQHVAKHSLEGSFFTCPECDLKDNNPYEFVLHLESHDINLMSCYICSFPFHNTKSIVTTYASHLELHRPIHFIDCPNCERTYKRIYELRKHFYSNHVYKRRCPECDKSMTRYKLLRHLIKKHNFAKNRICENQVGNGVPERSNTSWFGANTANSGRSNSCFFGANSTDRGMSYPSFFGTNSRDPSTSNPSLGANSSDCGVSNPSFFGVNSTDPDISNSSNYGVNPTDHNTVSDRLVDGIVGDSFGVPSSPVCQNSGLFLESSNSLYLNAQHLRRITVNQGIMAAQPHTPLNFQNLPNFMDNYGDTDFEDPTNVPIYDISGASHNQPSIHTQKFAGSSNWNEMITKRARAPKCLESSAIFDFFQNFKNVDSASESGSEDTATGDETAPVGVTTSDVPSPHFLDHNYAVKPIVGREKYYK